MTTDEKTLTDAFNAVEELLQGFSASRSIDDFETFRDDFYDFFCKN